MTKKYEYPNESVPDITYDTSFLAEFEAECIAKFKTEYNITSQPVWSMKSVTHTLTKSGINRTAEITVHSDIETFKIVPRHNCRIIIPNIDTLNTVLVECNLTTQAINWEAVFDTCIKKAKEQGQLVGKYRKISVYIFGLVTGSAGKALSLCVFPLSGQEEKHLAGTSLESREDTVQGLRDAPSRHQRIEIPLLDLPKTLWCSTKI